MHEDKKNQMKNLFKIGIAIITITLVYSCTTQSKYAPANIESLLKTNQFTFVAERANPTNLDVVNVMNSIPGSSSSRMLNLDPGYTIEIKADELNVTLPYFGRMYSANMDPSKNSYRFTTKDFIVDKKEGKKGSTVFTIVANDQQNIRNINMEVFKNGKTYVWIESNDRQSISYDGYITANSIGKK